MAKKPHADGKKKAAPREHPRVRPLEAALLAGDHSADEEALRVSRGLRAQDRYAEARPLCRAAAGRTRAWRLEEALCALGEGDVAAAQAVAARDPAIAGLLGPVLAALTGDPAPEATSAALGEVPLALAAVVGAATRHDELAAREALEHAALKRSPSLAEYRAATELAFARDGLSDRPTLEKAARRLAEGAVPAVRAAICADLAARAPGLLLDKPRLLVDLAGDEAAATEARHLALASQIRDAASDPEHLARLLRTATHRAFKGAVRGHVALVEAFAQLSTPHLAARLLDEARAHGADPIETRRGAYLVERTRDRLQNREQPSADHLRALDDLASALAAAPGGEPLAAEALFMLAMHARDAHDDARSGALLARAETLAPRAAREERTRIELEHWQETAASGDEAAALAGVEALLVQNPASVDVWAARIDLAPRFERDTLTVIAAESTGDEQLQIDAQAIRVRRWERTLFDGLDAPGSRPGQIAAELEAFIRTGARGATLKLLTTHLPRVLEPLGEEAREAICLALVEAAWDHLDGPDQLRALTLAFRSVIDEPQSLSNLAAYLLAGRDPDAFAAVLEALGSDLPTDALAALLCAGLAVCGDPDLARRWLTPHLGRLTPHEALTIEHDLVEVTENFAEVSAELDIEEIVDRANEALLPGFAIDVLSDGFEAIEEAAEIFGHDEEQIAELNDRYEALPAAARRHLLAQLEELWARSPDESSDRIEKLLERLATGKITSAEKKSS